MPDVQQVTTPDGEVGTVMSWSTSQIFRVRDSFGETIEQVAVTPVLLDSGEVRFFREGVLRRNR